MAVPARARLVIVGGGFAGAATAYALARAGVPDVVVVEREPTCGYHASGRNAALCRQLTGDDAVTDYTIRGAAFLRDPPAGFSDRPLLRTTGSVLLRASSDGLRALAERAAARGLPHERMSMGALAAMWPRLSTVPAAGGVLFPTDGVIDIHALLTGYLAGARRGGVHIETGCAVVAVEAAAGGRLRVDTSAGAIDAGALVVAAGAWAAEVGALGGGRAELVPMHRHLFTTEPVADLDRGAPFVWHLDDEFYVRPEGAGFLISGCDEKQAPPGDAVVAAGAADALAAKLDRVAPGLADLGVARAWACLRTFAPDRRLRIAWDEAAPRLFWVAGLGGHGATASAAIGEAAARAITAGQ